MEYFASRDDLKTGGNPTYRCLVLQPDTVRRIRADLIGVDVWAFRADMDAGSQSYLFRWDGTEWIETTPEETGVTVTTSVS